ncbi:MAG: glucans biosynthesis glucosyltransferase MdoH [Verrucomicrobiota bacterium]
MNPRDTVAALRGLEAKSTLKTFLFFTVVLSLSAVGIFLMADSLWSFGMSGFSLLMLFLFAILFSYLSFGFTHALIGFLLRRCSSDAAGMHSRELPPWEKDPTEPKPRCAIAIPIYNEPVDRVFSGIQAIFDAVMRSEESDTFDFFILSDSTSPDQWVAEEKAWMKLVQQRDCQNRVFYRHRPKNVNKKSGNISDFCRTWGDHYRYLVVLDADSIMTADCLVELYRRMESNPRVGLIQTAPMLVGAQSLFGRMQQFANRLYGPLFIEGLAYWQQCGGNFWGHNAIIRLRPFIEDCDLPELPGRRPFGGHILSHDFVEAGLLRRAGWEVWLAPDLGGSYEEGPQGLIESAIRDQRWCQGNLQHSLLLFARGLRGKTRLHLANGILGYICSPLWLLFMVATVLVAMTTPPEALRQAASTPSALGLLSLTAVLLFGPKILCLVDLLFDRERRAQFGNWGNAATGVIAETIFSALFAPILMLYHTRFVICNLLGRTVGWPTQRRGADGTSWDEAISQHGWMTMLGLVVGAVTLYFSVTLFFWLAPVLIGLWFAIPLSVWTSRSDIGKSAQREKLFLAPEETKTPRVVAEALLAGENKAAPAFQGITSAVVDPFLNAIHVSLLRRAARRLRSGQKVYGDTGPLKIPEGTETVLRENLAEKLLTEGPSSLQPEEALAVLSDVDQLLWLHRQAWMRPSESLAPWWNRAIRETGGVG